MISLKPMARRCSHRPWFSRSMGGASSRPWSSCPASEGRRGDVVEAVETADLLGDIGAHPVQIRPEGGNMDGHAVHRDLQAAQVFLHIVRRRCSVPSSRLICLRLQRQGDLWGSGISLRMSITPSRTSPAPSSSTSSQARFTASRVIIGIDDSSQILPEASVRMPRARAVWRMEVPLKLADSKTTSCRVGDDLAVLAAHNRRPDPTGFVSSAMTSISSAGAGGPCRPGSSAACLVPARRTMIWPPQTQR